MWTVKSKVVLVIIGATGTLSVSLLQYPSNIPGKHEIKEIQKRTAMLVAAHILRKVIMKNKPHFAGEIIVYVLQLVNTEELQHYIP